MHSLDRQWNGHAGRVQLGDAGKSTLARRSIRRDPILPAPLSIVSDRRAPPVPGKIGRYEIAALLAGPSLTS